MFCCPHCNQNKGSDVASFAAEDDDDLVVRFFNPRKDAWDEHFKIQDGEILPNSQIGEVTVRILDFNRPERILLRAELIKAGVF